MENTPTLLTNRLILRQFVREDLPALFSILSDPEVNTLLPWFTPQSMEETLSFLQTNFLETYSLPLGYPRVSSLISAVNGTRSRF